MTLINTAPVFHEASPVGKALIDFSNSEDTGHSVTALSSGKILVAGYNASDFSLARLNSDGTLDTTFGDGGKTSFDILGYIDQAFNMYVVKEGADAGKILITGHSYTGNGRGLADFSLVRLNADGTLDTSFSSDGKASFEISIYDDFAKSVIVQSDGTILVAGDTTDSESSTNFSVIRLQANGELDTSFGIDGKANIDINAYDKGTGMVLSGGKILIAGSSASTSSDFSLIRLNANGTLDETFNSSGKATFDLGGDDTGNSVTLQADGKMLVTGYTTDSNSYSHLSVIRVQANGQLDTSFGTGGKLLVDIGGINDAGNSVTVQADGKILIAGTSYNGRNNDFSLIRLNSNGTLDGTFSLDGKATFDFGGGNDAANSVTVQADGKILIAGTSSNGSDNDFSLIRLNSDGSLDTSFDSLVGLPQASTLGSLVEYYVGAEPVKLDDNVMVHDAELAALDNGVGNYNGASVTLSRHGGASAQDVFSGMDNLSLSGGSAVLSGVTVGTVNLSGGTLVISFNASATQARVNEVLSSIGYANASNAAPPSVQIDWLFNDGDSAGALTTTDSTRVNITNPNAPVIITGTLTQGQQLTADTSALTDPDGMGQLSYQWQANGVAISGATASTLVLSQDQVGKAITVAVSYTDSLGMNKSFSSNASTNVENINDAPTGSVTFTGTATQGQTLTAANTLADMDGLGAISYQWQADGVAINGATASTLVLGQDQVGKAITVTASYTDGFGAAESKTSAASATVLNLNDAPTGSVTLSGTAMQGQTLTAANTLADLDGLGTISYQWKAGGVAISGATTSTLVLGQNQVGKAITVTATYTDGFGAAESKTSAASAAVIALDTTAPTVMTFTPADEATGVAPGSNIVLTFSEAVAKGTGSVVIKTAAGAVFASYDVATSANLTLSNGNTVLTINPSSDLAFSTAYKVELASGTFKDLAGNSYAGTTSYNFSTVGTTYTGTAGADTLTGSVGNDTLNGLAGNDSLKGGSGNDVLNGGAGNDTLNGEAGADTMTGGDGSDTYYVSNSLDVVIETNASTGGTDLVYSSLGAYTLGSNVENGLVNTTGKANITGNSLGNVLYAGAGSNVLDGGAGTDTVSYQYATAAITASLATTAAQATGGSGSDTLKNVENLIGSKYADKLTGNAGSNSLKGGSGNDVLNGGAGNDTLNGEAGADTMTGGDGSDTYYVSNSLDVVIETNASTGGTDLVYSSLGAYTLGSNVENGLVNTTGKANITGNSLNNVLYAGAGSNVLDGGAGTDTVSYQYATAAITASLATTAAQATGGSGSDTLKNVENLIGSKYADKLTGGTGNNSLKGGSGNDVLNGGAGNDTLNGEAGADTMTGGDGSDTYYVSNSLDVVIETNASTGGTDLVYSSLGAYTLGSNVENGLVNTTGKANITGNSLNNVLYAGAGSNVLDGGTGTDTVSYQYATAAITASLATTAAQATGGSGSDTLKNVENLIGSKYADKLTGNAGNNSLKGGSGNDVLNGGAGNDTLNGEAGADTMTGGDGSDTYYVSNSLDVVIETNASTGGTDLVYSSLGAYTLGSNVENGLVNTTGKANITGNSLGNVLYAGAGSNVLDGGAGTDTVSYQYATAAITASLATTAAQATGGSGSDTLKNVENLIGSKYADKLTGNAGSNSLKGGSGNDVLNGGAGNDTLNGEAGADTMTGGDGSDTYYVSNSLDVVIETNASTGGTDLVYSSLGAYTLGSNVENGLVNTTGKANITGNSLNNVLYAGAGSNVLDGGAGTDTVSYQYATAAITASLATTAAQATGGSGSDTLKNVENLIGSKYADKLTGGTGNNSLKGGSGNDVLNGGAGNDTLNGEAGADTMTGGDGSDTYYVSNSLDVVIETNASTGGTDLVYSSLGAYTLGSNVENGLVNTTGKANITGNSLGNVLYAGAGSNVLDGGAGTDTVSYQYATAAITASLATTAAQATGGSGSDTLKNVENLIGSKYADKLTGGTGNNALSGGAGNDTLTGGLGVDTLTGGTGNDIFDFNALTDSGITSATRDVITDFVRGQDKIDLSTLDANTALAGNQAFSVPVVGGTFSGVFANAGDLYFDNVARVLYGNTDADATAEFAITLTGVSTLSSTDLVL